MKVIEAKHYVDGGPACDWIWRGTKDDGSFCADVNLHLFPQYKHREDCRGCHGTGLQAVEEWSDKVKAEWLKANNPGEGVLTISPTGAGWAVFFMGYEDSKFYEDRREYPITNPNGDDAWGEDKDFSAALTAAIVKVAEGAKCDSGK